MSFQTQLAYGKVAETTIAQWLMSRGHKQNTPLQGQAILYFGSKKQVFADVFSEFGQVLVHA